MKRIDFMLLIERTVPKGIGLLFIALGIIFNEWILVALLSPDGVITFSTRIRIWLFDFLMILIGFLIITYRNRFVFPSHALGTLALFIFSLVISLVGAEFALRITGIGGPWRVKENDFSVEPGGKFVTKHPALGYTHLPGNFRVILPSSYSLRVTRNVTHLLSNTQNLPSSYSFNVTHLSNTLRVTHPLKTYNVSHSKDEIWIFGCSMTHGWSLNDEETYPWLLQQNLPHYEIVNFGVTGYGTLHSLIQFREALEKRNKPKVIIIAYASFHDKRSTFLRSRRKGFVASNKLGTLVQPYARLNRNGDLSWSMATAQFHEFPFMRYLAIMHTLERAYNRIEDRFYRSHEVSKAIIKQFSDLCKKNGIELIIAGIYSDSITSDMLKYTRGTGGILTTDISVDPNRLENLNLPYDNHPSAIANKQYAQKLESFLTSTVLGRFLQPH